MQVIAALAVFSDNKVLTEGTCMQQNAVASNAWFMPAEWAPHAATWMVWPHNQPLWESGWGVTLAEVQVDFARVANAIARFEPGKMVGDPSAARRPTSSRGCR